MSPSEVEAAEKANIEAVANDPKLKAEPKTSNVEEAEDEIKRLAPPTPRQTGVRMYTDSMTCPVCKTTKLPPLQLLSWSMQ